MKQLSLFIVFAFLHIGGVQAMDTVGDSSGAHSDPLKALLGDYSFMSVAHIQSRTNNAPITLSSGKIITSSAPVVMIITQAARTE